MINVTKTFLPPQSVYGAILERAWKTGWITNRGELVRELETRLKDYLGLDHIIAMTNGTLPLQIAIKGMGLQGEIITTPFSYVATTSSIVWEGCTPVFVDIDKTYLTIDESLIEAAITPKTTAILATHVFGNPCNVEVIATLAKKHNLKVIYDAAHCFGVRYKGQSILKFGDASTLSFHATKLFHTGEGGALISNEKDLHETLYYHHNFGHKGKEDFQGLGINAKMSELQAAMGLAVLDYIPENIEKRSKIIQLYKEKLEAVSFIEIRPGTEWNNAYFPVIFESEALLLKVLEALKAAEIFPRRYFNPSLEDLPYIDSNNCPISRDIASRIACLPIYESLSIAEVEDICNRINAAL
ncbi:DegT/DnrJ/EryC1/StrS family aminotransferase [Gilvibacter sediminis]|uniref:DegT/DnrJ/EryC1/StrS family aminotransferase n=1 Tax=Gilvibacter sediminis TaxID=379071 RepID=UPI0023502AD5|nr:DegT/DnrJ/EryC1/StrS family aminotransferase [Gilvibacter sediminis]MDC7999272.1 DegT/DnrJ/EryC1/StrS family aminotransferase [Gilvibacter sediminis]